MRYILRYSLLLVVLIPILCSCTASQQQETVKYPRKPADEPERKSGPAMLFYEAAEEDADPNNIIVIPPGENKKKASP